ncbi:MAG TPA: CocE/NonD family hydrolase [Bacteroidota bacterium]
MKKLIVCSLFLLLTLPLTSFTQDSTFIREHYTKHEFQIPMRDGVKLFTIVYVPKDTEELHPFLLTRTPYSIGPYGPDNYAKFLSNLNRNYWQRSYIIVNQDVRGRFMSEGEFVNVRPFIPNKKSNKDIDESSDTYDTVEWLLKNVKGHNGRVGVKGISYPGYYATMASIDAHPAIKATSPQAPVSQWMSGDDFFHNGAFLISHSFDFFVSLGWPRSGPTQQDFRPFNHGTPDGYQFYLNMGPLPNANKWYMHDSVAFWNDMMNHGTWDNFWAERSVLPHVKRIKPATLVVGGWFDTENLYGALHLNKQIEQDLQTNKNSFVMGPWAHGWWSTNNLDSLGYIKFGSNLSNFYAEQLEVPFFEQHLRDKGDAKIAEATMFMTGANEWKRLGSWPPKNLRSRKLYLHAQGKLSFDPPNARGTEYDEYISDPAKPVPYTREIRHWYNAAFMVEDQRFASQRTDVVVFQSDVLTENVTIAGPITVNLTGATSGTDCDWIIKVIDVFPDTTATPRGTPAWVKLGGYQMMVRGDILRGKFRNSLAKPEAIKPDTPTKFTFDLQDVLHRFKKGHRIMVQIQSTWFPFADINPGKFLDIYSAKESDFQKTTQRVYHSSQFDSHLIVGTLEE